jgi:hypothetical protein
VSTSQDPEEWVSLQAIDPELVRRVADGEYQIDPHAVAEAMLGRRARLEALRQISQMLVASKVELPPSGGKQR